MWAFCFFLTKSLQKGLLRAIIILSKVRSSLEDDIMSYKEIKFNEFKVSPFSLIGKDWMIITAPDKTKKSGLSGMTASWGGLGVLWNKNVATVYIRPQRYTFPLAEECDRMALCFFNEAYKRELTLFGRSSGRELDKMEECEFTREECDGVGFIGEADTVLICKKIYADFIKEDCFIDKSNLSHYDGDYHKMYILEIEKILIKE